MVSRIVAFQMHTLPSSLQLTAPRSAAADRSSSRQLLCKAWQQNLLSFAYPIAQYQDCSSTARCIRSQLALGRTGQSIAIPVVAIDDARLRVLNVKKGIAASCAELPRVLHCRFEALELLL